MTPETRHSPYVPNTETDRDQIIKRLGVSSTDELFQDIPKEHYLPKLNLNEPLSELEITRELQRLSMLNDTPDTMPCFLGGGAYRHFIPSIVKHVINRAVIRFYSFLIQYIVCFVECSTLWCVAAAVVLKILFLCIISISFGCDCVFTYQLDTAAMMININSEFPILINIWET